MSLVSEGLCPGWNFVKYFLGQRQILTYWYLYVRHYRKPISISVCVRKFNLVKWFRTIFCHAKPNKELRDIFKWWLLHCSLHMPCCMHWFLVRNANPVFVPNVYVTLFIVTQINHLILTRQKYHSNQLHVIFFVAK